MDFSDQPREDDSSGPASPVDDTTVIAFGSQADPASIHIPGYRILDRVARGGQGDVFRALQESPRREVAIKLLRAGPLAGAAQRARFEREVQALAQLRHPHIVAIHASGTAAGCQYLVMDYVAGRPLTDWIGGVQPLRRKLELFAQICEAVQAAHAAGIVHRDLKPTNILIDEQGEPRVLDFGLVKVAGGSSGAATLAAEHTVTEPGQFLGSLPWASPEQAGGSSRDADVRSDVYSLGVMLYQLLTGAFPYDVCGRVHEVQARICFAEPTPPSRVRSGLERDPATIALKCLAKDPQRRYADAGAVARDIRRYLNGEPIEARREHAWYVLGVRIGRMAARHRITAAVCLMFLASAAAQILMVPVVFRWTRLNAGFERAAASAANWWRPALQLEHAASIALTDQTDVEGLAVRLGLAEVTMATPVSLRRMHGRLMSELARSGARAVVFDIAFATPSDFDADFVNGVRALRASGIPVVLGAATWALDDSQLPALSSTILPFVRWGVMRANLAADRPWDLEHLLLRKGAEPRMGLALAAVAAARQPDAECSSSLDRDGQKLTLRYWQPHPALPRERLWLSDSDEVEVSAVSEIDALQLAADLEIGDELVLQTLEMPDDAVLETATTEYGQAIEVLAAERPAQFAGRIVLIADQRWGVDRHIHADGRILPGCYAHLVGIESLQRQLIVTRPRRHDFDVIVAVGALMGFVCGRVWPRLHARRLGILLMLTIALAACSLLSHVSARYLCNPFVPLAAMWFAAEAAAALHRSTPSAVLLAGGSNYKSK